MTLFAEYAPHARGAPPPATLVVRPAEPRDVPALAAIRLERGDATAASARSWFERLLARSREGRARLLAALVDDAVVAYGTTETLAASTVPAGWYLGGVVVRPPWRRRGIGSRLVAERLAWIAARAPRAWYFTNARNAASIDLHAPFGFVEVGRGIEVPGVTFEGGVGLLYRADLPAPDPRAR